MDVEGVELDLGIVPGESRPLNRLPIEARLYQRKSDRTQLRAAHCRTAVALLEQRVRFMKPFRPGRNLHGCNGDFSMRRRNWPC